MNNPNIDLLKRQVEALEGSVKKWEGVYHKRNYGGSSDDCPCCKEFMMEHEPKYCFNCPISIHSGNTKCDDTPYRDYLEAQHIGPSEAKAAAKVELDFIKDVLTIWNKKLEAVGEELKK